MKEKAKSLDPVAVRIVQEARREFFSLGFSGVTMDDLAEKMGMSKKTLYRYFPGKEQLLQAVIQNKLQSADQDLQAVTGQSTTDLQARLSATISCLMRHMEEIKKPFIRDMQRHAPEFFQSVKNQRQEMINRHIGAIIEDGIRSGEMRGDVSSRLAMEILLGAINAVMNPAKVSELGIPPQQAISGIFTLFLEGMLVRRGRGK